MKKFWDCFEKDLISVNFEGLCCILKGDPSVRELMGALKRQNEICAESRSESFSDKHVD